MRRRLLNSDLNDGFSAKVSARALIIREPTFTSLAHTGTRPQWNERTTGSPSVSAITA